MTGQALLQVEGLTVDLPTPNGPARILESVSFEVAKGESLGLVGESGCGKSMTALAIMGLLPAQAEVSGRVLFEGRDLMQTTEAEFCDFRGRRAAMIFQEPMTALNPVKTIGQQIAEGPRLHLDFSAAAAAKRAAELLDRVGMPPERFPLSLFPHQLSGGQRQRVMIAMALACDPELIIADEPTTALDVTVQARVLDLIADLTDQSGMALLMITHDLGVVAQTTDRAVVMYAGSVVESAPTVDLFARMAHPYTSGLFEAMPLAPGQNIVGRRLKTIPGRVPEPFARPDGCLFAARCARASARCHEAPPPAVEIGNSHAAFCVHPLENAASQDTGS